MAQHLRPSKASKFRADKPVKDSEDAPQQDTWKFDFNYAESKPTVGVYDIKHRISGVKFRMMYRQPSRTQMKLYVCPWPRTVESEVRQSILEQTSKHTTMS